MKLASRTRSQVLWVSIVAVAAALPAFACTYSSNPRKTGQHFSVQVATQGKPIAGLQIELRTDPKGNGSSRVISTIITDESGQSEFINVKPGPYYIAIKHAAFPQSVEIIVGRRQSEIPEKKITFEWPLEKPLSVQSLSGLLNAAIRTESPLQDQAHPTYGSLGGAKLTLSRAVSGSVVEALMASDSGAFGFQGIRAGFYILRVEMPEGASTRYRTEGGYIPIEIDPSAKDSNVNLFLFPSVCGELGYENRQQPAMQ